MATAIRTIDEELLDPGAAGEIDPADATAGAEVLRGLGAVPKRVAALLARLAATARSFVLYDAHNDAIRTHIETLLGGLTGLLAEHRSVTLEILPFEMLFKGQRVYLNRDRERSLAFHLHRDGVRGLVLREGFGGADLARLLEILSVRYTGVHHDEDDAVTLLWKASFEYLDVIAVEGLVAEGGNRTSLVDPQPAPAVPNLTEIVDWPLPEMGTASTPRWVEVSDSTREAVRAQVSAGALPHETLRAVEIIIEMLGDPMERMTAGEALPFFEEARDFLLAAETLDALLSFIRLLRKAVQAPPVDWDPTRHEPLVELLVSCGDARAVHKVLHGVPHGERVMHPSWSVWLDLVCPDPFSAVADALAVEDNPAGRAVGRQLLEHYGQRQGSELRERFHDAHGHTAADFLRSMARIEGDAPAAFLARQCGHADPEVREEALWHLERISYTGALGPSLLDAFRRTRGDERRRVLNLIERSGDRRFVEPLLVLVDSGHLGPEEALTVGTVLGRLEGPSGLDRWSRRLQPAGRFIRRWLRGPLALQVSAAAAVAQVPGTSAVRVLKRALAHAGPETRAWIAPLVELRAPTFLGARP